MTTTGPAGPRPDVTYHGFSPGIIVLEDDTGRQLGVLSPVLYHSPTGLNWGYGGSGAADCARSLLINALGKQAAACPICDGTQLTVYDDTIPWPDGRGQGDFRPYCAEHDGPPEDLDPELSGKCFCNGGYRDLPYQRFKFAFVAGWPQDGEWTITRAEILTWLDAQPDWNLK